MSVLPACMCVYHLVPVEVRRGRQIPGTRVKMPVSLHVNAGNQTLFLAKAASALSTESSPRHNL